jgi:phosphoribosylanthranilate isomerase
VGLHAVQLHGDEPEAVVASLRSQGVMVLKALHVKDSPPRGNPFPSASALLLDAAQPGYGGGGQRFDWTKARRLAAKRPVVLAGGLNPGNVAEAMQVVRPLGVDVASGVERAPGKKDARLMAAFIRAVRSEESTS